MVRYASGNAPRSRTPGRRKAVYLVSAGLAYMSAAALPDP
jgi:hypothetical protein